MLVIFFFFSPGRALCLYIARNIRFSSSTNCFKWRGRAGAYKDRSLCLDAGCCENRREIYPMGVARNLQCIAGKSAQCPDKTRHGSRNAQSCREAEKGEERKYTLKPLSTPVWFLVLNLVPGDHDAGTVGLNIAPQARLPGDPPTVRPACSGCLPRTRQHSTVTTASDWR